MNKREVKVTCDTSLDNRVRETIRIREKALHDEVSALDNAENRGIEKGRAEGRVEGRAEERAEMIEKMKRSGLTEEQIQSIMNS